MTRRETIRALLERWDELQALTSGGTGSGEGRVLLQAHSNWCGIYSSLRCTCWLRTVAELERCLVRLRDVDRNAYRHLEARFGQAERVRRRGVRYKRGSWEGIAANEAVVIPRFERGQRGSAERVYEDVLIARWPSWVELRKVEEALDWIERSLPVEPALPDEAVA